MPERLVRNARPAPAPARPAYTAEPARVGAVRPAAGPLRLIYLDDDLSGPFLDQLAASAGGRELLAPAIRPGDDGLVGPHNRRVALAALLGGAGPTAAFDLCDRTAAEVTPFSLHPGQALAVTGSVDNAKDVTPAGFRLAVDGTAVRVLVDRSHALHLNQAYLAARRVTVLGQVHSVPRLQLRAVAVGVPFTAGA